MRIAYFTAHLLLRLSILALLILPLAVPTVSHVKPAKFSRTVNLITNKELSPVKVSRALKDIKKHLGADTTVHIQRIPQENRHELEVFNEIGQAVEESSGYVVLALEKDLWGSHAQVFNSKIKSTRAFKTERLFTLSEGVLSSESKEPENFILISDVYVPKVTFLGEETLATVKVYAKLPPNEKRQVEIILRANQNLVTSVRKVIEVGESGFTEKVIELPVSFLKAQTQVLNLSLQAEDALFPYNIASTTVFVAHSKTTALHVAVGPDWSLRNLRHKLKFWPNLDLLSYYILRERWDSNKIHNSQLSLIEFPSEKLFGEQLPNFHGIVAQNFYFDHYLQQQDALNLVNYVRKGGRMYLHAGPLSFLSDNEAIKPLFPCKGQLEFVQVEEGVKWKPADESGIELPEELSSQLGFLKSNSHFKGCEPKEGSFVLARLDSGDPILLASNLDSGLVISSLSADWHTQSTRNGLSSAAAIMEFNRQATASELLTQWVIEFLQRRQDSGLRPPDLMGPRLFSEDRFIPIRSRGVRSQNQEVLLSKGRQESGKESGITGRTRHLKFLDVFGIQLSEPVQELSGIFETSGASNSDGQSYIDLQLKVKRKDPSEPSSGASGAFESDNQEKEPWLGRGGHWPLLTRESLQTPQNLSLISGLPQLSPKEFGGQTGDEQGQAKEERPLLEVYPFLMALALLLLFVDTLLARTRRPR